MKKALLACVLSFIAACSIADPPYAVTIDFSSQFAAPLQVYSSNQKTFNVTLRNAAAVVNYTGMSPVMWYSPRQTTNLTGVVLATITNAVSTNGTFTAIWSPSNLNTNGVFWYGVGLVTNGIVTTARIGQLWIIFDPYASGASAVTFTNAINWALYNYLGTSAYGPYRAGSGTAFSTNPDGSVTITAGAGSVDLSFTNNYYRGNNPSNFCSLASEAQLTNGLVGAWITNGLGGGASSGTDSNAWHRGDTVTGAVDSVARDGLTGKQPTGSYVTAESDPIFTAASGTLVTTNDSRLSDARVPVAHTQIWSTISGTPTTVSGYGITDGVTNADPRLSNNRTDGAAVHTNDTTYMQTVAKAAALALTAWRNPPDSVNWTWTTNDSGNGIRILTFIGTAADVVVPSMLDSLPVVEMESGCIDSASGEGVSTLTLPHSITTIRDIDGSSIFRQVGSVVLSRNLLYISRNAYSFCPMTDVYIPASVTNIGDSAFIGGNGFISGPVSPLKNLYFYGNAPAASNIFQASGTNEYMGSTNIFVNTVTNYVLNPTATGWGDTFCGRPVVRLPLYGSGSNLTGITAAQVGAWGTNTVIPTNNTQLVNGAGYINNSQVASTIAASNTAANIYAAGGLTNVSPIATPTTLATPAGTGTVDSTSFYWSLGTMTSNIVVTVGSSLTNASQGRGFFLDFNRATNSITFAPLYLTNLMASVSSNTWYSTYWHAGVGQTNFTGNGR